MAKKQKLHVIKSKLKNYVILIYTCVSPDAQVFVIYRKGNNNALYMLYMQKILARFPHFNFGGRATDSHML